MTYVRYIDKTTDYYLSQGYEKSYSWAQNESAPFTPLSKPLSESRVGLLTTSELAIEYDAAAEANPIVEEGFRDVYAIPADTPTERFYSRTSSYDSYATHLNDTNAYFPVDRMREAVAAGRIGATPARFYGAYNNYSKRKVIEQEGPAALAMCIEDQIDAAVLVPV
jgi:D-proline reductase (dithiol) PrdB